MKTVILYGLSNPKNVKSSYVCGTPFSYLPVTNSDHHHIEPHNGNASHDNGHPSIGVFFLCLFAFNDDGDNCHSHSHHRSTSQRLPLYGAMPDSNRDSHLSQGVIYLYSFISSENGDDDYMYARGKKTWIVTLFYFYLPDSIEAD